MFMNNKVCILILSLIIIACEQEDVITTSDNLNIESVENSISLEQILSQKMSIGKKLPNPYSVSIMQSALENVKRKTKTNISIDSIYPTHHYVMFKPSCHNHYRALIMDDDLDINPYPLDHEIEGGWVVVDPDPRYSTNGYQHKWAYVPIDKDLSTIDCPYEILYDICCPDEECTKSSTLFMENFKMIEEEAHRLCGLKMEPLLSTKATSVTPHGRITYRDSSLHKYIGCYGMSVKARRLTKSSYGHCDDEGYFECDKSFKYKWTYTVFFGRTDFETRRDTETEPVSLVFDGYHSALNLQFAKNTSYEDCIFYCEILRAACKYFYGEIDGLRRPPYKDELEDRIYLEAIRGLAPDGGYTNGFFQPYTTLNSIPYIRIYRDNYLGRRSSGEIYWTTIHELAHSSHWKQDVVSFLSANLKVVESYATGIAWYLTKKLYPAYNRTYDSTYTGIIQDLLDNDGIKGTSSIPENVSDYSILEVESSVIGVRTWNEWRDNIIQLYPYNPTISNVSNLFSLW